MGCQNGDTPYFYLISDWSEKVSGGSTRLLLDIFFKSESLASFPNHEAVHLDPSPQLSASRYTFF